MQRFITSDFLAGASSLSWSPPRASSGPCLWLLCILTKLLLVPAGMCEKPVLHLHPNNPGPPPSPPPLHPPPSQLETERQLGQQRELEKTMKAWPWEKLASHLGEISGREGKLAFSTVLVPGTPPLPKSKDARAPYIKWYIILLYTVNHL